MEEMGLACSIRTDGPGEGQSRHIQQPSPATGLSLDEAGLDLREGQIACLYGSQSYMGTTMSGATARFLSTSIPVPTIER